MLSALPTPPVLASTQQARPHDSLVPRLAPNRENHENHTSVSRRCFAAHRLRRGRTKRRPWPALAAERIIRTSAPALGLGVRILASTPFRHRPRGAGPRVLLER